MNQNVNNFVRLSFWEQTVERAAEWVIRTGPTILVILVVAWGAHRLGHFVLAQLRLRLIDRHHPAGRPAAVTDVEKRMNTLIGILRTGFQVMLWGLVFVLLLRECGVDIAPIIAGAGIVGLAVGFGAQNLVKDFISGFFLILENHVRVGDSVVINDQKGTVESVGLRTILLRDDTGALHVFANGQVAKLANASMGWSAAPFSVTIGRDQDPERALAVMRAVGESVSAPGRTVEVLGIERFTEGGTVLQGKVRGDAGQAAELLRGFYAALKPAFDAAGIAIFPPRLDVPGEARRSDA